MKNTFRYSLKEEDYLNCEKFKLKKNNYLFSLIILITMVIAYSIYFAVIQKNMNALIICLPFIIISVLYAIYLTKFKTKRAVKKYVASDRSYLGLNEITIDENAIETKSIPNENEAAIISIYPYSVMRVIYETDEYFYFLVSNEIKILPKKVIPQEMKEAVFKAIKSNKNCIFTK